MKKVLLIALAAVAALASCAREELAGPAASEGQKVLRTFTVNLPDPDPSSKTMTIGDGKVDWEQGDSIFFNDGTTTRKIGVPSRCTSFDFTVEVAAGADNFVALYSNTEVNPTFSGDQITIKTSLAQNRGYNIWLRDADVLVAKSSNGTLNFKHAFGLLGFDVSSSIVRRIMVRTPDHTGIGTAGDGAFPKIQAMADDTPMFIPNQFTDAILMNIGGSGTVYAAIPPCVLPAGTEFWFENTDGKVYCRKTTQDNEIEPGKVLRVGTVSHFMSEENLVSARFEKVTTMPSSEDLLSKPFLMCATVEDKTYEFTGCASGVGQHREITDDVVGSNITLTLDNLFNALHFSVPEGSTDGSYNIDIQGIYLTLNGNKNNLNKANPLPDGDNTNKGRWTLSIDPTESAVISNVNWPARHIRWNSGDPRFVTYTTQQTYVDLYMLKEVVVGKKEVDVSDTDIDTPGCAGTVEFTVIPSNIELSDISVVPSNNEFTCALNESTGVVTVTCPENGGEGRNITVTVSSKTDAGVEAKTVTLVQRAYYEGLGELNGAMTTTRTKYTVKVTDAVVTYANTAGTRAFIQDAFGGVYVYLTGTNDNIVKGKKYNGNLGIEAYKYNGAKEAVAFDFTGVTVTEGEVPAAKELTVAALLADYDSYEGQMIVLKGVTVDDAVNLAADRGGSVSKDGSSIAIYSQQSNVVIEKDAVINVTAFPTYYNTTKQIGIWEPEQVEFVSRATVVNFAEEKGMTVGGKWTLDATSNSTGAITYESSDPTVVSIADGVATALKAGTAVITASVAAADPFPANSARCTVTVVEAGGVPTPETISFKDITPALVNGTKYGDPFDGGNFTITFSGGDNDGKYYTTGTGIRLYNNTGTMVIAAKDAHEISKIEFTFASDSYGPAADKFTVSSGSLTTGASAVWTGTATSVTIKRNDASGQWRLQAVKVTYSK